MTINIMGTNYKVFTDSSKDDVLLSRNDGYIAPEKRIIVLDEGNNPVHQRHVLTHEIVHGFLYESGLDVESWGNNEEIVDWISLQLEKMHKLSKKTLADLDKKLYPKEEKKDKEEQKN